jgi:hypothetical protein
VSGWGLGGITALGLFHGVNPAMGWLFAVAIGLQERSRRALLLALPPIALGHAAAVGIALFVATELESIVSLWTFRLGAFAALAVFAWWRFVRPHAHARWMTMRIRGHELVAWSFLMSSAHGAGLMLFPFALSMHAHGLETPEVVVVHSLAMLVVAAAAAIVVYEVVGVGILRRGWLNLDRVWAYALGAGAVATLFVT